MKLTIREMAVFSRFGSEVDNATKKTLKEGETLTMLLKQTKGRPYSLFEETSLLMAFFGNVFNEIQPQNINIFADKMLEFLHKNFSTLEQSVNLTKDISESDQKRLMDAMISFAKSEG